MEKMTTDKEFERRILESLDELAEKIKESDKIKGKSEALAAYNRARKLLE